MSLPDSDLAYHVAHELTHRVLAARGYPRTVRGAGYPEDSAEARIGADLEEMVLHPPLESLLQPFGFTHHFIQRTWQPARCVGSSRRRSGIRVSLALHVGYPLLSSTVGPAAGTVAAAGDCILGPRSRSDQTRQGAGGDNDRSRLGKPGTGPPGMIRARDTLALDVQDKVLVLDAVTGRVL